MSKHDIMPDELDTNTVYATLSKDAEGNYIVTDFDGTVGDPCKLLNDGGIALTPNKSNRQWINKAKADAIIEAEGKVDLYYKATKKLGPVSDRIPYANLLKFMSDDIREEYLAIVAEAKAAMEADKKKPLTEREKLEAKIAKAQKKLAELAE